MILRVGLTGGLASGKSTVGEILAGLGCKVVDADEIVDRLYEPGEPGHRAVVREYGRRVLTPEGEIDRPALAALAFASREEADRLNRLIHPLVIEREKRIIAEEEKRSEGEDGIVVAEATLLLESGGRGRYDRVVVVDLPEPIQIERAAARGMDREDAENRIRRQMDRTSRRAAADYVIDNSGSEEHLETETRRVHELLLADLRKLRKGK
ncbi:MAG TPA: dephospho-CoA kinase [Thermoanaerobaculia bacterium]|nr:dephospho-CoA kinase [Thermoanaerobaculia bacterium]